MIFIDLIRLNEKFPKERRFTKEQWEEFINEAYINENDWSFKWSVENFYTGYLDFEYEDCKDLITNIQNGYFDAFVKFIDDIVNYLENNE